MATKFVFREEDTSMMEPCKAEFKSIEYRLDEIYDKINNIDSYNEREIKDIIKRQYNLILDYDIFLASPESRSYAQRLFSNDKFLKCLIDVVGLLDLNDRQITCINKLAYDYYITPNRSQETFELLFQLTGFTNELLVIKLSAILGFNGAKILAMIANSTFRADKRAHRINTFIVRHGVDFTVENIIDILSILYSRFGEYFKYSMLETKTLGMSQQQQKNFDSLSSAIVTMIGCMTSIDMKRMFKDYGSMLKYAKPNTMAVRFSIKSIPNDRIQAVVRDVEMEYNVIVP